MNFPKLHLSDLDFLALRTDIGERIEQATNELLVEPDLTLSIEICDLINRKDEGPDHALRALKKRLNEDNTVIINLALDLLQSCMQNCGPRFHNVVAGDEEFIQNRLVPIARQQSIVGEKCRGYIGAWAHEFKGKARYSMLVSYVDNLKNEGISFPEIDEQNFSPLNMPIVLNEPVRPVPEQPIVQGGRIKPTAQQLKKLNYEIKIVQTNVKCINDLLDITPEGNDPRKNQLLLEVTGTTQTMHARLLRLIDTMTGVDEFMALLLETNDSMLRAFQKFSDKAKPFVNSETTTAAAPVTATAITETNGEGQGTYLIDLGDSTPNAVENIADTLEKTNLDSALSENPFYTSSTSGETDEKKKQKTDSVSGADFEDFLNENASPATSTRKATLQRLGSKDRKDDLFD